MLIRITDTIVQPNTVFFAKKSYQNGRFYQKNNKFVINEKKLNVMLFNKSIKIYCPPEFAFRNGEIFEIVERPIYLHLSV